MCAITFNMGESYINHNSVYPSKLIPIYFVVNGKSYFLINNGKRITNDMRSKYDDMKSEVTVNEVKESVISQQFPCFYLSASVKSDRFKRLIRMKSVASGILSYISVNSPLLSSSLYTQDCSRAGRYIQAFFPLIQSAPCPEIFCSTSRIRRGAD